MIAIIGYLIAQLLQIDYIDCTDIGDNVIYKFKTTCIKPFPERIAEIKTKIFSIIDLPIGIPSDITVKHIKDGIITSDVIVEMTVQKEGIGKIENLLATKYGIIRKRPYKNDMLQKRYIYEELIYYEKII